MNTHRALRRIALAGLLLGLSPGAGLSPEARAGEPAARRAALEEARRKLGVRRAALRAEAELARAASRHNSAAWKANPAAEVRVEGELRRAVVECYPLSLPGLVIEQQVGESVRRAIERSLPALARPIRPPPGEPCGATGGSSRSG
jgi:hypothetical protein